MMCEILALTSLFIPLSHKFQLQLHTTYTEPHGYKTDFKQLVMPYQLQRLYSNESHNYVWI